MDDFKDKQDRIIKQYSKERKEAEKLRRLVIEKQYYIDLKDQSDEDNDWDKEPKLRSEDE